MDQESFRRLLQTPRPGGSSALGAASGSRGSLLVPPPKKKTSEDAFQPAFKPRTVKKKTQDAKTLKYRDRAAERRVGDGNDYAHIEAVLEDFERKNADEDKEKVEEQRKYLGGDSDHSILVKGLDFALLEQNKARSAMTNDDVDALDQAYLESSSHSKTSVPKKRTREDLLRELKEQRASGTSTTAISDTAQEEARLLEQAKQKGKFKPIGQADLKKKKSSKSEGAEGQKKKRKVDTPESSLSKEANATADSSMPPPPVPTKSAAPVPVQEEVIDDDFDIFAGAGEYEDIDIGDDEDEYEGEAIEPNPNTNSNFEEAEKPPSPGGPQRWVATGEPESTTTPSIPIPAAISKHAPSSRPSPPRNRDISDDEDMEDGRPMRLAPLASSALPSIKDFLAMDKAAGSHDKKKKRKEKKKGGEDNGEDDSKKTIEAKVDRDYQRLKSYTEKKAAAGSK